MNIITNKSNTHKFKLNALITFIFAGYSLMWGYNIDILRIIQLTNKLMDHFDKETVILCINLRVVRLSLEIS